LGDLEELRSFRNLKIDVDGKINVNKYVYYW